MTGSPFVSGDPPDSQVQARITPGDALEMLKAGNRRFVDNQPLKRDYKRQIQQTADGQYPFAAVLSCIDSRVPTGIVFDQGLGDLFDVCMAGNAVNEDILGCLEFACQVSGSKLVVVMGHTMCGAVKGACDGVELGHLTQLLRRIRPAVDATESEPGESRSSGNPAFVDRVALRNVRDAIEKICEQSEILRTLESHGSISIVGAMYDVASGEVFFFD